MKNLHYGLEINYNHIPKKTVLLPSEAKIVRLDIKKEGTKIGCRAIEIILDVLIIIVVLSEPLLDLIVLCIL